MNNRQQGMQATIWTIHLIKKIKLYINVFFIVCKIINLFYLIFLNNTIHFGIFGKQQQRFYEIIFIFSSFFKDLGKI